MKNLSARVEADQLRNKTQWQCGLLVVCGILLWTAVSWQAGALAFLIAVGLFFSREKNIKDLLEQHRQEKLEEKPWLAYDD